MELPPPMKVLDQPMSAAAAQGVPGPTTVTPGPPLPPLEDILPDVPNRVSVSFIGCERFLVNMLHLCVTVRSSEKNTRRHLTV